MFKIFVSSDFNANELASYVRFAVPAPTAWNVIVAIRPLFPENPGAGLEACNLTWPLVDVCSVKNPANALPVVLIFVTCNKPELKFRYARIEVTPEEAPMRSST